MSRSTRPSSRAQAIEYGALAGDYLARALHERGKSEYDRLANELLRCARAIDGSDDWTAVLERLNKDHPQTPEAMRQTYADWTERARQFLAKVLSH